MTRAETEKAAREAVVLAAEFLFRKDEYGKRDYSNKLHGEMCFAEDKLRANPLVAQQLEFYKEKEE